MSMTDASVSICPSRESQVEKISCKATMAASSPVNTSAMRLMATRPSMPRALWMLYVTMTMFPGKFYRFSRSGALSGFPSWLRQHRPQEGNHHNAGCRTVTGESPAAHRLHRCLSERRHRPDHVDSFNHTLWVGVNLQDHRAFSDRIDGVAWIDDVYGKGAGRVA